MGGYDDDRHCDGKGEENRHLIELPVFLPRGETYDIPNEAISTTDGISLVRTIEDSSSEIRRLVSNHLNRVDRTITPSAFAVFAIESKQRDILAFAVANEVIGNDVRIGWVWVSPDHREHGLGKKVWTGLVDEIKTRHPQTERLVGRFEDPSPDGRMRRISTENGTVPLGEVDGAPKLMSIDLKKT